MAMEKKDYKDAEIEVIRLEKNDVITTSGINEAIGGSDEHVGGDCGLFED